MLTVPTMSLTMNLMDGAFEQSPKPGNLKSFLKSLGKSRVSQP